MRPGLIAVPLLLLTACTASSSPSPAPPPSSAPAVQCGYPVETDALPKWARGGFTGDGSGAAHVLSRAGDMVAVLFGNPLTAPPAADHGNKILWVAHTPASMGDKLHIAARLAGAADITEREVAGGPGPSIIDLPKAGCWRLTLQWSGHTDFMDLTYVTRG
jgi:hypothetical protein